MRAQVTLIPSESKKLIAKAVARMDEVQNAFKKGIVAMHPGSSTIFIAEELTGKVPATEVWVSGLVAAKGTCGSGDMLGYMRLRYPPGAARETTQARAYPCTWMFKKGELIPDVSLGEIVDQMGTEDVYIKGVNAIDPYNTVGVLIGDKKEEGGTIGLVMSLVRRGKFKVIFPVGLEKLIPVPMKEAAEEAAPRHSLDYSMGVPCAVLPCEGIVVTEPRAIEMLTGATATPISAGGLGGAAGAITMVIKGDDSQVTKAINYCEQVKGARVPRELHVRDCKVCDREGCSLRGGNKPWC